MQTSCRASTSTWQKHDKAGCYATVAACFSNITDFDVGGCFLKSAWVAARLLQDWGLTTFTATEALWLGRKQGKSRPSQRCMWRSAECRRDEEAFTVKNMSTFSRMLFRWSSGPFSRAHLEVGVICGAGFCGKTLRQAQRRRCLRRL